MSNNPRTKVPAVSGDVRFDKVKPLNEELPCPTLPPYHYKRYTQFIPIPISTSPSVDLKESENNNVITTLDSLQNIVNYQCKFMNILDNFDIVTKYSRYPKLGDDLINQIIFLDVYNVCNCTG